MEANGGGIYIGGTGKREGKEGGKGIENKKLPITADRNPYTYPLYPILVVILLDFLFFFFGWGRKAAFLLRLERFWKSIALRNLL